VFVLAVFSLNLRFARACSQCGEPLHRSGALRRPTACPSCGGALVPLWAAAMRPPQKSPH
jgi:hypothetical protein